MKKISFAAPHEVAIEIEGVKIKVISLPRIEIRQIYALEQRLARQSAIAELAEEKDDLVLQPFDAQAWAQNWCETNTPNYEAANEQYSTWYAKHNGGKKPPQNLYEVQLMTISEQNAVFGTYHHFIVDAETGEYFVDFAEDFKAKAYSLQRAILTEWITNYDELKDLVSAASLSNLLGFTEAKTKATAAQELTIIQDTGKKE